MRSAAFERRRPMTPRTTCGLGIAGILALVLAGCADKGVDISADGSQVAVSHAGKLWVADIEQENWRKVPLEGASATSPSWSPDGRYVLFELQPDSQGTASAEETSAGATTEQKPEPAYAALFDTR